MESAPACDLPSSAGAGYVHRIGRTGRAGATGLALSFCDDRERSLVRDIERLTGTPMTVLQGQTLPRHRTSQVAAGGASAVQQ